MPLPPPRLPSPLAGLVLVAVLAAASSMVAAAGAAAVPLRFSLCGPDNLGVRGISLNQWPGRERGGRPGQ